MGIQANIGYGKAEINFPISTDALEIVPDGFGFGVTLGLLYKPVPQLNIGLKWRSPSQFTLKGDAEISDRTEDEFKLFLYYPQAIIIGFGYMPIDNLTVELDFTWYHWSHFGHSQFSYDNWHSLDGPLSRGMKDCYRISIGLEYLVRDNIALWTGYLYNTTATKKEWISPLAPDITNHNFGLGYNTPQKLDSCLRCKMSISNVV